MTLLAVSASLRHIMTRWRLITWWPERPAIRQQRQFRSPCKMCAIKKAMAVAAESEQACGRAEGSVAWRLDKPDGHLGEWVVAASSDQKHRKWMTAHGH